MLVLTSVTLINLINNIFKKERIWRVEMGGRVQASDFREPCVALVRRAFSVYLLYCLSQKHFTKGLRIFSLIALSSYNMWSPAGSRKQFC